MKSLKLKNNKGFTLLEALVAISILMVAVAAPITIAQKGLSSAVYSKDQMIAAYLAQDAIEYIKNRRDNITINNDFDWAGLTEFSDCFSECQIDTISGDVAPYDGTVMVRDEDNFYRQQPATGADTKFIRKIEMVWKNGDSSTSDEVLITVTVSWGGNQVVVNTLIYNY